MGGASRSGTLLLRGVTTPAEARIRTIYDCCADIYRTINGDGAVTGYCYSRKKVFCIGYRDTTSAASRGKLLSCGSS